LYSVLSVYAAHSQQHHFHSAKQVPKYTLSSKSRFDADGRPGLGWTDEGIAKYNQLYKLVEQDRVSRGAVFNAELLNVYLERRRVANATPKHTVNKKRKIVPFDDMGIIDTSLGATSTTEEV
jgi:hypothetical protein